MGKTDVALASEQEPAQEPDELLGSFVGFGAVEARYTSGPTLANVVYPPVPGQMIYRVDPVTGVNVERIA